MDAIGLLESIKNSSLYRDQIVHIQHIPARKAAFSEVDPPLTGAIGESLERVGIKKFYIHQAESIQAVRRGENVIVVTATASGKTLCYNVPVLESLEQNPKSRALYIYPTKALAQDQLGKLRQFELPCVKAATYDGDTPRQERPYIKIAANVILTNPDMLHVGIMPYHTSWADMFRNLKYIVIDEVHMYRGVFGAHVANIIRRLRRITEFYGAHPQFVCASATVRDPGKLFHDLTGLDAHVIDRDGSPSGDKVFAFWNPPFIDKAGERRSSNIEAVELFTRLIESGTRTIVFTKARKVAEVILRNSKIALKDDGSPFADKIMSYRAGYMPSERREIEQRLFSGELLGVTSTTALEVGVDIGGLDAAIMTGYPGTVASTWQQAGRAGRGTEQSMAILIAYDNPIDQYIVRNPGYFFSSLHERAIIDSQNPYILADHLLCAAHEIPIENTEVEALFGERAWEVLGVLADNGTLSYRRRWYWTGTGHPAADVNIRSSSNETFNIVNIERGGTLLGTVDGVNIYLTVYPGAIYLHGGESYIVTRFSLEEHAAFVERTEVDYYTTPGELHTITVDQEIESRPFGAAKLSFGDVEVSTKITHFWRKQLFTERIIDKTPLDLPEVTLNTEAVWITLPIEMTSKMLGRGLDLVGSIHAIEHAAIGIMPLFALCDRNDIGGVSNPEHPDTDNHAAIFIYDGHRGGVGLSRTAYETYQDLLTATLKTIEDCECEDGCPSCIQSPKCGNNNEPLDKAGAVYLLREVLKGPL